MTYSLNTLNNPRGAAAAPRAARRPLCPRNRAGPGPGGPGVLAARAGELFGAGRGVLHLRHRRRHPQLGRAPGRLAGRRQLFPAGLFGLVVRGRGRARLARDAGALDACAARSRQRRAGRFFAHGAWPSGSGWPCCCARARRSNGRACTASKRACPITPAARWARWSGPGASSGWASPARAWCSWRWSCSAPPWCSAFPGATWPSGSARWIDGLVDTRREKREMAQDLAFGQQAARQREEILIERAHRDRGAPSGAGADRAGAGRGAQERAGAPRNGRSRCSPSCPTPSCRRWTCWTAPLTRQETVAPETLEMTSRLIEKKLKDFGVEVRVVLAQPGPGDHALRDRAGHRREGLADRRPGQGPGALAQPGVDPRGRDHPGQELHGAGTAQRQAPVDPALRDPGLAGLQRSQVDADHGPGQGHRRQSGGGRPGQDAARAGGRHHRLGQVGGPERDDPVAAVQGRGARRAPADDRSQDAGDVGLRGHSAPAGAGGHRHAPGGQRPELVRGRDGAALQADEQAGRAQPGAATTTRSTRPRPGASSSTTRSA